MKKALFKGMLAVAFFSLLVGVILPLLFSAKSSIAFAIGIVLTFLTFFLSVCWLVDTFKRLS